MDKLKNKIIMRVKDFESGKYRELDDALYADIKQRTEKLIGSEHENFNKVVELVVAGYYTGADNIDILMTDNKRLEDELAKMKELHGSLDKAYGELKDECRDLKIDRIAANSVSSCIDALKQAGYHGKLTKTDTIEL